MNGMTGYSFNEFYFEGGYISTEIKTVNHKFLELNVSLPHYLNDMDLKIRELVQSSLKRGKVDVFVVLKLNDQDYSLDFDCQLAKRYVEGLRKLADNFGLKNDIDVRDVAALEGVVRVEKKRDNEKYFEKIIESLKINLDQVLKMRAAEGASTRDNLKYICSKIDFGVAYIENKIPEMEKQIFENIKSRVVELIGDRVDEARLLNEVAFMSSRSCINEEVERLKMHLKEFLNLCDEDGEVGKRLDFICQELQRDEYYRQ
ncbi:MAG TPA: YicC family protein [Spirochaetota bacterium]|nr:YicC family protein [Spirochaetota bacterium]